jgi:hypothetical protein
MQQCRATSRRIDQVQVWCREDRTQDVIAGIGANSKVLNPRWFWELMDHVHGDGQRGIAGIEVAIEAAGQRQRRTREEDTEEGQLRQKGVHDFQVAGSDYSLSDLALRTLFLIRGRHHSPFLYLLPDQTASGALSNTLYRVSIPCQLNSRYIYKYASEDQILACCTSSLHASGLLPPRATPDSLRRHGHVHNKHVRRGTPRTW